MRLNLIGLLLVLTLSMGLAQSDVNSTDPDKSQQNNKIEILLLQNDALKKELLDNNIWSKIYGNYHSFKELKKQQLLLNAQITSLEKKRHLLRRKKNY